MGFDEIDKNVQKQKKKAITITMNPDLDKSFTKLARGMGASKSKIIEQLVIAYMDSKKNLFKDVD